VSPRGCERTTAHPREETLTIAPQDPTSIDPRKQVERWFLELRSPLFRFLRTLRCRPSVAEEITQETFLRLHRALRDGLQMNDVQAWLFRVARNLYIDSQRGDQRYGAVRHDQKTWQDLAGADSTPDPEQQVLQRERIRLIADRVARLPPLQRECIRLKAQGLRYQEIAAALGIPMTAAVDCVRQAVKRLGRRFGE